MADIIALAKPKVIIRFHEDGCLSAATDIPCDVICVDERTPNDRVYRMQPQVYGRQIVKDIIGASDIGHAYDQKLSADEVAAIQKFFDEE
jgi:hypothetical protein